MTTNRTEAPDKLCPGAWHTDDPVTYHWCGRPVGHENVHRCPCGAKRKGNNE